MTHQLARPEPLHSRFGDAFVILSVTLLSLAAGAWLIARLEFELWPGLLTALAIYCSLLLMHLIARRVLLAPEEEDEPEDLHWQNAPSSEFEAELASSFASLATADAGRSQAQAVRAGAWPTPLPMPEQDAPKAAPASAPASDPFQFRPARQSYLEDDGDALVRDAVPPAAPAKAPPKAPGEAQEINVDLIQDLIKKLADELNSTAAREAEPQADHESQTDAAIGRSAAALDTAARTMRHAVAGAPPAVADRRAGPAQGHRPAATPKLDPELARIAEAVAAERMEVLLEPIHVLAEGRPRHYEVSMRLLAADGTPLEQPEVTRAALGSGLMPRIDAARMLRAARVARRLGERGRSGSVLAAVAGESLTNDRFLDTAALHPGSDGRIGLVLSFAQSDVRTFTPVHAEALGTMAASGFRFALEDVTDLDMDFGGLKAMGFEFIKLDAQVFLDGLPAPEGRIPAADICRYLAEFGLTLIVGRIEDDWLLGRILGFGVLLGKGALFGGPKLVKAEVVAEPGSAAA